MQPAGRHCLAGQAAGARKQGARLSATPSCSSNAHSERQKPWLGQAMLRRACRCARARAAGQVKRRIRYAAARLAERLTPAPQCTSTAARAGQRC